MEIRAGSSGTSGATPPPETTFTGDVLVDYFRHAGPSHLAGAWVEFGPGARTPWKVNPLGQTIAVLSGAGRAGTDGGEVTEISAGDVVWFEPGERHWEGASPDGSMVYLALQEEGPGAAVSFDAAVSEEEYAGGDTVT